MKFRFCGLALLGALLTGGCASKGITVTHREELPGLVGHRVTLVGAAGHSCPGAMVLGAHGQVYIEGMKSWPAYHDPRTIVQVAGVLMEHRSISGLYVVRDAKWTWLGSVGGLNAVEMRELQRQIQSGRFTLQPAHEDSRWE